MEVSIDGGTPIAGWFSCGKAHENDKMDDNWGYPHDLGNHHMYTQVYTILKWLLAKETVTEPLFSFAARLNSSPTQKVSGSKSFSCGPI